MLHLFNTLYLLYNAEVVKLRDFIDEILLRTKPNCRRL